MAYIFDFNKLFAPVFRGSPRIIDVWGGRGRGGSHFITDFALFKITQKAYFRAYFMREVKGQVRESLFRDFKDRIEENPTVDIEEFKINESTMEIVHLATGNTINCRGFKKSSLKHTAKQKSLAGATHIFIDEADEINEDDFDQFEDPNFDAEESEEMQGTSNDIEKGKKLFNKVRYTSCISYLF